jgi:hypothetical protein
MGKFFIDGIMKPGRVNVKIDGGFRTLNLYDASDEVLEKLYNSGCIYVKLAPGEFLKRNVGFKDIKTERLDLTVKAGPEKKLKKSTSQFKG